MRLKASLKPPKPKEHGAWGMVYIPFFMALGIAGILDTKVLLLFLAVTLVFLSQRPLTEVLNRKSSYMSSTRTGLSYSWLGFYWTTSAILFGVLYFHYQLLQLPYFALIMAPVVAAVIYFVRRNSIRTVAGELLGILGLTLTAPLTHYVASGQIQLMGFVLWGLNFLYFGSSIFYVKAKVEQFRRSKLKFPPEGPSIKLTCVVYHFAILAIVTGLMMYGVIPLITLLAFLPILLRGLWEIQRAQVRLSLRKIGLWEVAYCIFFALIIVWALGPPNHALPR
jgi:hypothetical protein